MLYFCVMGVVLAIDYGSKRSGIAVTDNLKMIAHPLDTVGTPELVEFLKNYSLKEEVDLFVVGLPKKLNNQASEIENLIKPFIIILKRHFPNIEIVRYDERFTSKIAFQSLIKLGLKKKKRRDKTLVDKISATLILQSYLDYVKSKQI